MEVEVCLSVIQMLMAHKTIFTDVSHTRSGWYSTQARARIGRKLYRILRHKSDLHCKLIQL